MSLPNDYARCADGHAEGADGPDAWRGAADVLLTEARLREMRQAARLSDEAEHTVWWLLLCRAVERAACAQVKRERDEAVALLRKARDRLSFAHSMFAAMCDSEADYSRDRLRARDKMLEGMREIDALLARREG